MIRGNLEQTMEHRSLKDELGFRFFLELYKEMNKDKDVDKLQEVGGVRELAKALEVDLNVGIDTTTNAPKHISFEDRKEVFGTNVMKDAKPRTSFPWKSALLGRQILTALIFVATVNTILGFSLEEERGDMGWIAGIGTWVIVLIIVLAGITMDYLLFRTQGELKHEKDVFDVRVLRDGKEQLIKNSELLVGDIQVLAKDVTVAADGVLCADNDLFINEEIVTGESTPIEKKLVEDPFCRSGTKVTSGSGRILVTAVGEDSESGQTLKTVSDSTDYVNKWMHDWREYFFWFNLTALFLGVVSFIVLLIRWMVDKKRFPVDEISDKGPVHFLILTVAVVMVEIPKGYLLSTFFHRIYLMWTFAKDKVYFHTSDAFGPLSNVSSICFDKTGTMTKNKMTAQEGWFQGQYYNQLPSINKLNPMIMELITENASLNSEAFLNIEENGFIQFVGSQTECALLIMTKEFGVDYSEVRSQKRRHIIKNYGFNSDKKMSTVIVRHGNLLRLYNKGAAELVLNKCAQYIDPLGSQTALSEDKRVELENVIKTMASKGLRTLASTYADLDPQDFNFSEHGEPLDESLGDKRGFLVAPEKNLVLLAIVGIKDPVRKGVSRVVNQLREAGITVRMITGENPDTAEHVARACGILTSESLAMEGAEFRRRVEVDVEGLKGDLPQLQVLARSSPSDKEKFVKLLKSTGEEVAVCGDGTNDARAIKESTVGIAMGVNSREVSRKASDVVILSDDISSVLTLHLGSRRFRLSSWGYFQFRLSVTLVVWIVVLVSVCVGEGTPLNAQQFLWASLITDCMIALTFATENPPARVPNDGSYRTKRDPTNQNSYLAPIFLQSLYQIIVIICTFYSLSSLFERYGSTSEDEYEAEHDAAKMRKSSMMFNIFIFMQLFNSLNCRKVFDEYNIFEGLFNSPLSLAIRLATVGLQLLVMLTPMRTLFKVTELNAWEWFYSIVVSAAGVPLSILIRYGVRKAKRRR